MHERSDRQDSLTPAAYELLERMTSLLQGQDFVRLDVLAEEAGASATADGAPDVFAVAAECRAQADYHLGRYPAALRAFDQAIQRWSGLNHPEGEARARLGHSGVLSVCGLTAESLDAAYAALALLDETTALHLRVGALLAVARCHTVLRAWDEAARLYANALEAARERADDDETSRVLVDLGYFYSERSREALTQGDRPALRTFAECGMRSNQEALSHLQIVGPSKLEWIARINLGECLMNLGLPVDARITIDGVLDSIRRSSAPSSYCKGEAWLNLGQISLAEGLLERAVDELKRALAMAREDGMSELAMRSCEQLTMVCEARHEFREALDYHKQFFAVHVEILSEAARLRAVALGYQLQTSEARAIAEAERARAVALALDNRALQRESLEDSLTGLPNHRSFQRTFERLSVEHTDEHEFYLAVIDVDHFKRINDGFSHQTGDDVLKTLARILREQCRHGDFAARYGGEEFTLLLPACSLDQARAAAERIRLAIENHDWQRLGSALGVTVSIGLAGSRECVDRGRMFEIADRRMYRAKDAGRNRVVASET